MTYQPFTGVPCSCKPGIARDNCPVCEGTGKCIDFGAIRAATNPARGLWWEVTGYTKTGMYSRVVEAPTREEALRIAKPLIVEQQRPLSRVLRWSVREDS